MAKTTSQIVAENKAKRAEEAAIGRAREAINQKQLSAVSGSIEKTKAVLKNAIAGTTDAQKKANAERAYKSVISQYNAKTKEPQKSAVDQMWERASSTPQKTEMDDYRKRILDLQKQLTEAENAEIDWTSAADRQENARQQEMLQSQIDKTRDEMNYRANMGKIDSMSEEQKRDLETLANSDNGFLSWMNIWDDQKALKALQNPEENEYAQRFGAEQRLKQSGIGSQQLQGLSETYQREMNRQDAEQAMEEARQKVQSGFGGAVSENAAAFANNLAGSITGTLETADQAVRRAMGKSIYSTADTNRPGYRLSQKTAAAREATSEQILGEDPTLMNKAANILYKGGTSAVDNVLRGLAGGGTAGSLALAGMGSFQDSYRSAAERGADDSTALLYGSVTAALEVATEFLPTEHLLGAKSAKECESLLRQAFVQAGLEIPGEEISLWGEIIADAYIMGDKSENNRLRAELIANGYSKEQADNEIMRRNLMESAETALTTLISSGGSVYVQGKVDSARNKLAEMEARGLAANNAGHAQNLQQETTGAEQQGQAAQQQEPPAVDEGQQIINAVAEELAQRAPKQEAQAVTPEMEQLNAAIAETIGVQPAQKQAVDKASESGYDNSSISPSLGASVGNTGVTYTSDNKAVPFRYAVVPAESLIASNDPFGNVNSAYPEELQPRDRTRTASQIQISKMAQNLNPALLAESATAENGAPIIRGDGVVVGGNARVNAIGMAYGSGNGGAYQQFITEKAAELGIDPATLPANPVLVRITNGADNYRGLATALNETGVKANSPSETAKIDASKMGDIIQYLSVGEDGDMNTEENREFIQQFTTHVVPSGEQDTVMQGNSQVSQAGIRRMQYALFHYAYNDTALLERLAESTDNNAKNITNAMVGTAGKVAQLQTEIGRGEVQDFGLQNAITNAVNLYLDSKAGKQTVDDSAGQLIIGYNGPEAQYDGLTVNLAKFMEANNRSGKQIRDFIDILVDVNMNMAAETATEVSMFDTGDQQTQEDLYDEAVKAYDQKRDGKGRIPEKSGFSHHRQFQPGELAEELDGSSAEGSSGETQIHGGGVGTVPEDAPGGQRNLTEQNPGIKGTGAAEANFSGKPAYNATLSEDNAQADRADDVRPMELPERDINGGKVSAVTGNVYGSKITPDDFASLMEEPTAKGDFSYMPISNDRATEMAKQSIERSGNWETAYADWAKAVAKGQAGAEMSARGALLLNKAAQDGNKGRWLEILSDMRELGTNTAQGLQAFRLIRTLTPPDKLEFAKVSVKKLTESFARQSGLQTEITIDESLIKEYENARTDKQRDEIMVRIQQNVAAQIPSTFMDKFNALRYLNMLGNLKTTVRNVAGNVGASAAYRVKDTIAAGLERAAYTASGGKTDLTKSVFASPEMKKAAAKDFEQYAGIISDGGKFSSGGSEVDDFTRGVMDSRRIFKNGVLEGTRKATNWAMNNKYFGDEAFGRAAYSRALAGYLQANGVKETDFSKIDQAFLNKAREYAVKQAQEATFHDNNTVSKTLVKLQKDTGIVGQGILPFAKTPANVLVRAEEFSPLGFINSTIKTIQKAAGNTALADKNGGLGNFARAGQEITGADLIDSWSKSFTGAGLFVLGAWLADQGWLIGSPDEDEDKAAFDKLNGIQPFSLMLPGGENITIDFLSPIAMTLFMGANAAKIWNERGDFTYKKLEKMATSLADPMIQMSMLQGVDNTLNAIKYTDNNLGQFLINAGLSYLFQGFTSTLVGQVERALEKERMTTYVDKNSSIPDWMQKQIGKVSQKIPGWDYQQTAYIDARGQTQENMGGAEGLLYNFASPGYIDKKEIDAVSAELYRLNDSATFEGSIFPESPQTSFSYTGKDGTAHKDFSMSAEQADTLKRVTGQTGTKILADMVQSKDYAALTDNQKAQAVKLAYEYAREKGRGSALEDYPEMSGWMAGIDGKEGRTILQKVARDTLQSAVSDWAEAIKNGWDTTGDSDEMESAYKVYDSMSLDAKKKIEDSISGDAAAYLEIRSGGVATEKYIDVVSGIKSLNPEKDYDKVRDTQIREEIAENRSLSARERDIVMKAYMPDYDPKSKKPDTTELKYDEVRKLGVSAKGYSDSYRDYLNAKGSGSGMRRRTIKLYMDTYGWDRATAQKVYDLYAGYYKPWEE